MTNDATTTTPEGRSFERPVGRHEYGVRVAFARDVLMGNRDKLWTIQAGSTGTTAKLQYGFGVELDGFDGAAVYVYADPEHLRRIVIQAPNTPVEHRAN